MNDDGCDDNDVEDGELWLEDLSEEAVGEAESNAEIVAPDCIVEARGRGPPR